MAIRKIELSCPNCGASDSVPAQHGARVCRFCGTHFTFEKSNPPPAEKAEAEKADDRRWRNLRIILATICTFAALVFMFVYIWLVEREEAKPDNRSELEKIVDDFGRRSK